MRSIFKLSQTLREMRQEIAELKHALKTQRERADVLRAYVLEGHTPLDYEFAMYWPGKNKGRLAYAPDLMDLEARLNARVDALADALGYCYTPASTIQVQASFERKDS